MTHAHPGETDEMVIFASTQNPHETQMHVAEVLGIPANRVVCRVRPSSTTSFSSQLSSELVSHFTPAYHRFTEFLDSLR